MKINPNTQYYKGHKYKIYPTEEQKQKLDRYIDLYRYVYNWALAREQEIYELYKNGKSNKSFYTHFDLNKLYIKFRNLPENQWLLELPVGTAYNAIRDMISAYKNYFNKITKNKPIFKSKKNSKKSFSTKKERFYIDNNCIRMEGLPYGDRIDLRFNCNISKNNTCINPTISKDYFGDYYISFCTVENKIPIDNKNGKIIGIDLGVRNTLTTSIKINNDNYHQQPLEKIRRLKRIRAKRQIKVSRDQHRRFNEAKRTKTKYENIPKSKRQIKREKSVNKINRKIHNIKNTYYDTIIKRIIDINPKAIVMEDFKYNKIINSQKYIARYMVDTSFYAITQKMKYQCNKRNISFIQAPAQYPSSQICSACGNILKLGSNKMYKCPICGNTLDRDLNAAYNLENYYYQYTNTNILVISCI